MQKINVTIDWTDTNFSATTNEVGGAVIVTAKDLGKLNEEFKSAFDFHVEGCIEDGDDIPNWVVTGEYEFEYHYTTAALLHKYDGILSRAALARLSGINERQIGHYASGLKTPRPATRIKLINGLHQLGNDLMSVV
ncbi:MULTISPECIES: hypothetical protein [unclassified Carboxylicivirga]|uniref:hypothetical protein n=1 Tax=Carboxylicivirga TaxID=1628153 RepID=UPI003D34CF6A